MAVLSLLRPAGPALLPVLALALALLVAGCGASAPSGSGTLPAGPLGPAGDAMLPRDPGLRPLPTPSPAPAPGAPPQASAVLAGLRAHLGPDCVATGAAVHLGQGRFVTSAHLVDGTQGMLRRCPGLDSSLGKPVLLHFQGREQAATLVRLGRADLRAGLGTYYVGGRDVALLQLAEPPRGAPALALCADDTPFPGERVLVLTPYRQQGAEIAGLMREANPLHGGYAEMLLRLEAGESGGAVLDAGSFCLLGLVSHRQEAPGLQRTRIVTAPVLRRFLAE